MKVKVLRTFKDRYTKAIHRKGDVLTINKDRYAEITAVGPYVEEVKAKKVKETAE